VLLLKELTEVENLEDGEEDEDNSLEDRPPQYPCVGGLGGVAVGALPHAHVLLRLGIRV
jgi:hypothetical protein